MPLFQKVKAVPAAASVPLAAAAGAPQRANNFLGFQIGMAEQAAMSVPSVTRAISLLSTVVSTLDLRSYTLQWTGQRYEKLYVEGESWMTRPNPTETRNFTLSVTVRDLIMQGRAFWVITSRYANGFPATFQWLPAANIETPNNAGPQWFGSPDVVMFNGVQLDVKDVVTFLSGSQGIVYTGNRAIQCAIRLDEAAARFASNEIAAGYLQQTGGEPMSGDELAEMASAWASNRRENAIGALNDMVDFKEFSSDPSKLQLVEGREYSAKDLSRLMDIPAYLLAVDQAGSMTYSNAQEARRDLIEFGARPLLHAIAERLSMDDVLPRGRHVEFDTDTYIGEMVHNETQSPEDDSPAEDSSMMEVPNND
jgi:phage portal protein BeeE